jgi:2-methylisocitrate lyase-like PEP mutase family enzyme
MDAKTQQQYARTFHNLHRKGKPLTLFNARDVATAKAHREDFYGRSD